MEVSLYSTAYCGPNGVLIIEVSLYRTAYCGHNGVLIIEVHCIFMSLFGISRDDFIGLNIIHVFLFIEIAHKIKVNYYVCMLYSPVD